MFLRMLAVAEEPSPRVAGKKEKAVEQKRKKKTEAIGRGFTDRA